MCALQGRPGPSKQPRDPVTGTVHRAKGCLEAHQAQELKMSERERKREAHPSYHRHPKSLGFPGGSAGKESTCNEGDLGLIPGLGRSPGGGKGYPLQCSGLENPMDCTVPGVTQSRTRLSGFHFSVSSPYTTDSEAHTVSVDKKC